jgi:cobalt-zinc-cadmium efflux system membrane fusion protein
VLVFAILGGLVWWGHKYDWSFRENKPEVKKDDPTEESEDKLLHGRLVKLDSEDAAERAGISWSPIEERMIREEVHAPGELQFDTTRLAHLSSRANGTVWRVEKQIGETANKGDILAYVESAEVAKAKSEFLLAVCMVESRTWTLKRTQGGGGVIPDRVMHEAEHSLHEAKIQQLAAQQALLNLGVPVDLKQFEGLDEEQQLRRLRLMGLPADLTTDAGAEVKTTSLLPIAAPFKGTITRLDLVRGMVVGPAQPSCTIADTTQLWLMLDVLLEDAARLRVGQKVTLQANGLSDLTPEGTISWISAQADEKTRTVKARAVVPNPTGLLRANVLGKATILVREQKALSLPAEAVQWIESQPIVFVKRCEDEFETRVVRLGAKFNGHWEVLEGVKEGEEAVTAGGHVLKSELFKSRISGGD